MSSAPWERVKELLHAAMEMAPERCCEYLDAVCGTDAALRAELESLLSANAELRSGFLEQTAADAAIADSAGLIYAGRPLQAGQLFAQRFQLVRKLGEGGMGQVWLADQIMPVHRQVALKLIKAGMYDENVANRFQSERQSLAIMDHPAIAKVFEAGATPQGQPYFVMEYVPGLPITDYCDRHRLNIRQRLELFIQACEGVQHAHQKAIIHRDLKPANILVVEVDGSPKPRIIDFGLARAVTREAVPSQLTKFGHLMGTPGYMSPEQVNAAEQDVDTRTDVYSLGATLYVLLCGMLPFETTERQTPPLDEILRQLREDEPPIPSTRLRDASETASNAAASRATEPKRLVSQLRGDLDWITMKALERDRSRRYGTPSELAADLRRYLAHEPVSARPASALYRLGKYTRRHRVAIGFGGGLLVLLGAFVVSQTLNLRRITQERDRATRITDFMTGMFRVSDPSEARGNKVTAREILDKASSGIDKQLAQDPDVQSQMMFVMASTYLNLGLYARAHELAQRSLDQRMRLHGADDPRTSATMAQLGWILSREGHDADAEKLERQALAGLRREQGSSDPLTLETMDHLALILQHQGHAEEGEKLDREVVQTAGRFLGAENPLTLASMNHLGAALLSEGRYADAEKDYRQLLGIERRVMGDDHPETLKALNNLASAIQAQGRLAEAEPLYREILTTQQRVLGPEHQNTLRAMESYANLLASTGQLADAEKIYRQLVAVRLRTLGPEHPDTLNSQYNLADLLIGEGNLREAEPLEADTLAKRIHVLGPANPFTLMSQSQQAHLLVRKGQYASAETIARSTFADDMRLLGVQHAFTVDALQQLGTALAYSNRYDEASELFRDLISRQGDAAGQGNRWYAWYAFACVAAAAGRADDAVEYLQKAVERGYRDFEALMHDYNFESLLPDPKFQELAAQIKPALPVGVP